MAYNVTEKETQPKTFNHFNGSTEEILARYCISELLKGWPVYRDVSEWKNFRSIFTDEGAHIFTTWSGGVPIDDFIRISQEKRAQGDFIMHRENGTLVDLNLPLERAVGRMKATITQRVNLQDFDIDVECDCRVVFFVKKQHDGWKAQYSKVLYEKDRLVPVDGNHAPEVDLQSIQHYPVGYRYLAWAQSQLGHKVPTDLPTLNNEGFYKMTETATAWLEGNEVDIFW
ncbi:uncharacterized protein A1O9_12712 [Exophiala aquamarina CBS 119918]|uniref:SnoaL-like domain-containing protein n=1 Tax=Exophiala aquamarina CBS 119918 TaxID=1182545 RepID=A0A072NTL8_9EURO|nr:uncharacterized protein A1O9_12712 [Exophiala aquamarina CBS 119918]KEF51209.1 hypothetical protein A1O9_12712 [Exophiala aquamarina CBS 119918]